MVSQERSVALYPVLILIGIGIEIAIALPVLLYLGIQITFASPQFPFGYDLYLSIAYFVIPIFYCITLSFAFRPKHILSPLHIQLGTFGLATVVLTAYILRINFAINQVYAFVSSFATISTISLFVIAVTGFVQLLIVRRFVGLGLIDPLNRITYLVNKPFKSVRACIDEKFLNTFSLVVKRDDPDLMLLSRITQSGDAVIVAVGPDSGNGRQTRLATVSYHRGFYELTRSNWASGDRDNIVGLISNKLKMKIGGGQDAPNDLVSAVAYDFANQPTRSVFSIGERFISRIPTYFQIPIVATFCVLGLLIYLFATHYQNFGFDTFLEPFIITIFTLVIEIWITVGEVLSRERRSAT
jgi:hypothetical protein